MDNQDQGNPKLRGSSVGVARQWCKANLIGHPRAQKRYEQYSKDYGEVERTYNSTFRGCEKGSRRGKVE